MTLLDLTADARLRAPSLPAPVRLLAQLPPIHGQAMIFLAFVAAVADPQPAWVPLALGFLGTIAALGPPILRRLTTDAAREIEQLKERIDKLERGRVGG